MLPCGNCISCADIFSAVLHDFGAVCGGAATGPGWGLALYLQGDEGCPRIGQAANTGAERGSSAPANGLSGYGADATGV